LGWKQQERHDCSCASIANHWLWQCGKVSRTDGSIRFLTHAELQQFFLVLLGGHRMRRPRISMIEVERGWDFSSLALACWSDAMPKRSTG
jgi:hypothetical protein